MRFRSLTARLTFYCTLGLLVAYFTLPATVYLPYTLFRHDETANSTRAFWAAGRAREIVLRSLRKSPDGARYVETTDALRAYEEQNPEFRFAVLDARTGYIFPGSSNEAAAERFSNLIPQIDLYDPLFHITSNTPIGKVVILVYGSYFHWNDMFFRWYTFVTLMNILSSVVLCVVFSSIAFWAVRKSLAPLRLNAARISKIDVNSLKQKMSTDDFPSEIVPFVHAVNDAFQRVREGVERQRRFIANSAHELRTPIAVLGTRVDKLEETPVKVEIAHDVFRVQTIIEQLLALARIEARGQGEPSPHIDIAETVLSAAANYMPIALDNGRHIAFEAPPGPIMVCGYQWAVESIVTNLIENAVRAEPADGTVIVRVTADATVEVVDHGEGVAPADREKIFEPFWRKSDATPGTGLGLAISRELIDKLGGRIWVEETPGGGATFKIALPPVVGSRCPSDFGVPTKIGK